MNLYHSNIMHFMHIYIKIQFISVVTKGRCNNAQYNCRCCPVSTKKLITISVRKHQVLFAQQKSQWSLHGKTCVVSLRNSNSVAFSTMSNIVSNNNTIHHGQIASPAANRHWLKRLNKGRIIPMKIKDVQQDRSFLL